MSLVNVILGYIPECPGSDFKPVITQEVREFFESLESYLSPSDFVEFMALVKEEIAIPTEYRLGQNYPNPFNPTTTIHYAFPDAGRRTQDARHVTLKIYNVLGQEIRTLVEEEKEPGYYTVTWDGVDSDGVGAASGIYFYRLKVGDFNATKRMVLMK